MTITSFEVRRDLIIPKRQRRLKSGSPLSARWSNRQTLNKEVKDWIREMVQSHWYLFEKPLNGQLFIAFCDDNDAMRYKLTWH